MQITIDGQKIEFNEKDANIVTVADKAKIKLVAPCYRAKRKRGCCKACIVEIDGKKVYACATTPIDGMQIIYNRDDLKKLRQQKMKHYKENKHASCKVDSSTTANCPTITPLFTNIETDDFY